MLGAEITKAAYAEGYEAAKAGAQEWHNPYDFHREPFQAYGWEGGYRDAKAAR